MEAFDWLIRARKVGHMSVQNFVHCLCFGARMLRCKDGPEFDAWVRAEVDW